MKECVVLAVTGRAFEWQYRLPELIKVCFNYYIEYPEIDIPKCQIIADKIPAKLLIKIRQCSHLIWNCLIFR